MKMMNKILLIMMCVAALFVSLAVGTYAASDEPNITFSDDKTEVQVGDNITVTLGIKEMTGTSLAFGFDFDRGVRSFGARSHFFSLIMHCE